MTHIMKMCWNMNKDKLRKALSERTDLNSCSYEDLVKLTFETIYNGYEKIQDTLDLDNITVIDDGDYQGTLFFMIPYDTYQPGPGEYVMTHIYYGSCSHCDALQSIQDYWSEDGPTEEQISGFMSICEDLVCNAIKPYNIGWRADSAWNTIEEG